MILVRKAAVVKVSVGQQHTAAHAGAVLVVLDSHQNNSITAKWSRVKLTGYFHRADLSCELWVRLPVVFR